MPAVRILPRRIAALFLLGAGASASAGTLSIAVDNVRNATGNVHVDICPEAKFLKDDCPWSADAPARPGRTMVTVNDLPAGRFAVQAYHDENRNHDVDRNFIGIPKEGIGFSNDARISLGPPKFADAAFDFDGTSKAINLKLRYFLGKR